MSKKTEFQRKPIFVDKSKIRYELEQTNQLVIKANHLTDLLFEYFTIAEPDRITDSVELVHQKLFESVSSSPGSEFQLIPEKIAELIGKGDQYRELMKLIPAVIESDFLKYIRWNKEKFSISSHAERQITESATFYLEDPQEIALANQIEKFLEDGMKLINATNMRFFPWKWIQLFPFLKHQEGKLVICHDKFIRMMNRKEIISTGKVEN